MSSASLLKGNEFWKCRVEGDKTIVSSGKLDGRPKEETKSHGSAEKAREYMGKQRNLRMQKGFVPQAAGAKPPAASKAKAKAKAETKARAEPKAKAKAKAEAAPKRKNSGLEDAGPAAKRARADASPKPKAAARSGGSAASRGGPTVDSRVPQAATMTVVEDYSVKLNQTNIGGGANNNKFYIIQVLESGGKYFAWNRWGRVGDEGQNKLQPCASQAKAVQEFEKKFRDKTGNNWSSDRSSFVKKAGKYGLVETEDSAGGGEGDAPMGKLTEVQIQKGQAVLDRLRPAVGRSNTSQIDELSSQFYSLIPHNFGWKKPPAINTMDLVEKEAELLKFFLRMGFEKVDSDKTLSPISGVMSLPCPPCLEDAAKGICASSAVSSSNKQGKDLAARQAGGPSKKMDAHLYAAIMLYTSNAIYVALNKCLRDSDRVKVKKYFKYLRLFFEAMDCLPKQKRTLWRGISVDLYHNSEYSVGNTVTWWGVSSCTSDQKVAQGFAKGCGGNCTLVTVQSTSACDISAISFFGNEKESLLRPGTQLKVKSKAKKGNVTEITLQEVGCAIG